MAETDNAALDRAMTQAEELGCDVAERIERKYVAGQQEHGGDLDEAGVHALCEQAEEEVLDLAAYLWHLRRALSSNSDGCRREGCSMSDTYESGARAERRAFVLTILGCMVRVAEDEPRDPAMAEILQEAVYKMNRGEFHKTMEDRHA